MTNRTLKLLGGAPASGKSVFSKDLQSSGAFFIELDKMRNDKILSALDEYQQMSSPEENRFISTIDKQYHEIMDGAISSDKPLVLMEYPFSNSSEIEILSKKARSAGRTVEMDIFTVDIDKGWKRYLERQVNDHSKFSNKVNEVDDVKKYLDSVEPFFSTFLTINKTQAQNFSSFGQIVDKLKLWDNNSKQGDLKLIAEYNSGVLTIHDDKAFDKFLNKKSIDTNSTYNIDNIFPVPSEDTSIKKYSIDLSINNRKKPNPNKPLKGGLKIDIQGYVEKNNSYLRRDI